MRSQIPKVMHPIGGLPMIAHVLHAAQAAGCARIGVVIAPGMGSVAEAVMALAPAAALVTQREQLGTGHAVRMAQPALQDFTGNLLVLYGDTPLVTPTTMQKLLAALGGETAVCVLGFRPQQPGAYGRLVVENGQLTRIVEAREATEDERAIALCNSGVMALRGDIAWELVGALQNDNTKGEYYLTDIVALAIARGLRAQIVEADAREVLGVNSRAELSVAEAEFQARARAAHMENGVTLIDPASVHFSADTQIAPDTLIEPQVFFGPGVRIAGHAHIKAFSHIEGADIGPGAIVGPFARLRPGTALAANVRIGNFVEIKQSRLSAGAKVNHLSYVGDASVGEGSNLGAGTITCNYDGVHKYRTEIGREVFIGSNTALVAPVSVGDGAMVAAGSVITEDVAPGALALARSRQTQKSGGGDAFRARAESKKNK